MRNLKIILSLLVLLACRAAHADKFTLPVLPDTQCEVDAKPAMFTSQLKWIVANKETLKIPFVLHVGDLVNWDTPDHRMWATASDGFKLLDDAGMDYAIALGNHDTAAVKAGGSAAPGNTHANVRITESFNTFFPPNRFRAQRGQYEPGKSDNAWYTFSAGGLKWLVLSLEFCARQGPVDWAKGVIADHPEYNVILLTHFFLTSRGDICPNNAGYGDLSATKIYDQLVSAYPNVLLVLSGHVDPSAWRDDVGPKGNHIYQLLQDYQGSDLGGGYIRLLEIDTTAGTISARMYSPFYDKTKTDASQFAFTGVKFIGAR